MNTWPTLLWLELKRTAWVLYGAGIGLVLFAAILQSMSGVVTGLDALNLPLAGAAPGAGPDCVPPNCPNPTGPSMQMSQETSDAGSSFSWSYSSSWGGEPDAKAPGAGGTTTNPSVVPVPIPEEFQLAVRPRQLVAAATTVGLTGLMLLGFWIAQSREADRGEMVILYQSPVSGTTQLAFRFLYIGVTSTVVLLLVIAIYWFVQTSQSFAPLAPVAEALGARVHIHWGSLIVIVIATQILPNAAFLLLFIQMQNAYDLLGGKRTIGFVLVVAAMILSIAPLFSESLDSDSRGAVLHVISVASNPTLDQAVNNFSPSQYRVDVPLEVVVVSLGVSLLMLIVSGRIWQEVEWS